MITIFKNLIRDRTREDVLKRAYLVKKWLDGDISDNEKAEWQNSLKGAYNASDINRVSDAMNELSKVLALQGYGHRLKVKTNWNEEDYIDEENIEYYLKSLKEFLRWYFIFPESPEVPDSLTGLDWKHANDIEELIYDMALIADLIEKGYFYSGEVFAGEV